MGTEQSVGKKIAIKMLEDMLQAESLLTAFTGSEIKSNLKDIKAYLELDAAQQEDYRLAKAKRSQLKEKIKATEKGWYRLNELAEGGILNLEDAQFYISIDKNEVLRALERMPLLPLLRNSKHGY